MRLAWLMMLACLAAGAGAAETHAAIDAPLLGKPPAERAKAAAAMLEPTRIRLDAHMRLGEAIALLAKSGNPTALAHGLDATRSADIGQDGDTYWAAVAAVCKAFALKPSAGSLCAARVARDDLVAIEAGPLLLADAGAERAMLLPCGPVALAVKDCHVERMRGEHTEVHVGLTASLRLEPRVPADAVGWCGLRIDQVADQRGRLLPIQGQREHDFSEVARDLDLQLAPSDEPSELSILGELHLALAVPWRFTTAISAGDTAAVACGDHALSLLLIDGEHSAPAGTQGPLIELDYPHAALLGEPRMSLARAGVDVGARGGGSFDTATGRSIILALTKIDADPYQATIVGASPLGEPLAIPLRLRVPLTELAANTALSAPTAFFAPSQVRWDAARLSLRDALAIFARAGDPVLLTLGTDERMERDLPAFSGTFWDGLLALCRAYGLQPAGEGVGAATAAAGGEDAMSEGMVTVGLGPVSVGTAGGPIAATASGPLLIESTELTVVDARSLGGGGRHLSAALRMRLEPRVPDDVIGECSATIDTFCHDDAGNVLTAEDPRPAPTYQRMGHVRWNRGVQLTAPPPTEPVPFPVRIDGLLPSAKSVTIGGHLRIVVQRRAHREVVLAPGDPSIIDVGGEQVSVTLTDQAAAENAGLPGPGVLVVGTRNLIPASLKLVAPSGAALGCGGAAVVQHNRSQLIYRFAVAEQGPHTLVIDDVLPAGVVRIPFTHVILVPDHR